MGLGRECRGSNVATITPDAPGIIAILTVDTMIVCIGWLLVHVIIRAQLGSSSQRVLVIVFGGVLEERQIRLQCFFFGFPNYVRSVPQTIQTQLIG